MPPGGAADARRSSAERRTRRDDPLGISDWTTGAARRWPHPRADPSRPTPRSIEERKWRKPSNRAGIPVWSHDGIVCTGETYKNVVKMTFAKGASLKDPSRPLQFQSRRQHQARHRHPRGRQDRRAGPEGAHQSRREAERSAAMPRVTTRTTAACETATTWPSSSQPALRTTATT